MMTELASTSVSCPMDGWCRQSKPPAPRVSMSRLHVPTSTQFMERRYYIIVPCCSIHVADSHRLRQLARSSLSLRYIPGGWNEEWHCCCELQNTLRFITWNSPRCCGIEIARLWLRLLCVKNGHNGNATYDIVFLGVVCCEVVLDQNSYNQEQLHVQFQLLLRRRHILDGR